MKWILGAFFGLVIAVFLYGIIGAVCNLIVGSLLGYRIQKCSFWGMAFINENGKIKFAMDEFYLIPEVFLDTNISSRRKKLILDIFPVFAGFCACLVLSGVFGDSRGAYRHIVVGVLSAMAILYCWHIFIVLKMMVYMKEKQEEEETE